MAQARLGWLQALCVGKGTNRYLVHEFYGGSIGLPPHSGTQQTGVGGFSTF